MPTLLELEKLKAEVATLEERLSQLGDPVSATSLEGVPTNQLLAEIQKNTERERARLEERQNLLLSLPILKQRLAEMEKDCLALRQELDRKIAGYQKLANKVGSSLDGILAQIEELKALGMETQAIHQKAYGSGTGRSPIWVDNWHPYQFDFPAIVVLQDGSDVRVVLTTQALKSQYRRN